MITLLAKYSHLIIRNQPDDIVYSVPLNSTSSNNQAVGDIIGNETVIRRKPGYQSATLNDYFITRNGLLINTLQEGMNNSYMQYGKYKCLFQRNEQNKYEGITYQDVIAQAKNIGSGIINLKLAPEVNEYKDMKLQMIGIHSINRKEWAILDVAAMLFGFTVVPLYDTLGEENLSYCLNHSGVFNMFASSKSIDILLNTQNLGRLQNLISFDNLTEQQIEKAKQRNINILNLQEVIKSGIHCPQSLPKLDKDTCLTFSYTSGTTGVPKCAMLSHKNILTLCQGIYEYIRECEKAKPGSRHLSYLPLPHVMERIGLIINLLSGSEIYFYSGNILLLKKDIEDVKPTLFVSVPRLFLRIYDALKVGIGELDESKKNIFERAYQTKKYNLNKGRYYKHILWDRLIFRKTRQAFGGEVNCMLTSSAPISADVLEFLKIVACCPIYEGYGQTESTGGIFMTSPNDSTSGHVGGPTCITEFKLQSVPELDYKVSDIIDGKPAPRGELCLRGPTVFLGYYKDEEKTNEAIDEDGWLHTGDVGMILPNGGMKIIDRKKNIFKLSQGEYVAPEKIENVYKQATGIAEIFVYGNSLESYLVALIVPSPEYAQKFAQQSKQPDQTIQQLCKSKEFYDQIFYNLEQQAKADKLMGFEKVKKIILEPISMTVHGCLTNTFKLQRIQATNIFKERLEQLYKE